MLNLALRFLRRHYSLDLPFVGHRHYHYACAFETRFARSLHRFSKDAIGLVPATGLEALCGSSPSKYR